MSSSRVLTAAEFEQIQRRQAVKEVEGKRGGKRKRGAEEEESGG